jgi:hypothetical protein
LSGYNTVNSNGVYNTIYVADPTSQPGSRFGHATAFDSCASILYIYGGDGYGSNSNFKGLLSDLWTYEVRTSMYTWIEGRRVVNSTANYGANKNIGRYAILPGARSYASMVYDKVNGSLYIAFGFGMDNK